MEENIGDAIVTFRAQHGLSQRAFAAKAGISLQTVYSIENDLQTPSKLTRKKIELVLKGEGE